MQSFVHSHRRTSVQSQKRIRTREGWLQQEQPAPTGAQTHQRTTQRRITSTHIHNRSPNQLHATVRAQRAKGGEERENCVGTRQRVVEIRPVIYPAVVPTQRRHKAKSAHTASEVDRQEQVVESEYSVTPKGPGSVHSSLNPYHDDAGDNYPPPTSQCPKRPHTPDSLQTDDTARKSEKIEKRGDARASTTQGTMETSTGGPKVNTNVYPTSPDPIMAYQPTKAQSWSTRRPMSSHNSMSQGRPRSSVEHRLPSPNAQCLKAWHTEDGLVSKVENQHDLNRKREQREVDRVMRDVQVQAEMLALLDKEIGCGREFLSKEEEGVGVVVVRGSSWGS
ncbi:hypothetical protein BDQ17DRAFT_1323610 [Cyathus striatus]|nr:hypothetical protein BDQ17DRAFT_1323610 [Cyathus striatus]